MLFAADAHLAQRDKELRGLSTIMDPEAFLRSLGQKLPDVPFEEARATYVRYKPFTNCLIVYSLFLGNRAEKIYVKTFAKDVQKKLTKAGKKNKNNARFGSTQIVLEDCASVVTVFPHDLKIKHLEKIGNRCDRVEILKELFPNKKDWWQGTFRSLQYKAERRFTSGLEINSKTEAIIKFYTPSGFKKADPNFNVFRPQGDLHLAKPIGRSEKWNILAFQWVPGTLLREINRGPDDDQKKAVLRSVGKALAELHSQKPKGLHLRSRRQEIQAIEGQGRMLVNLLPSLSNLVDSITKKIIHLLDRAPTLDSPIHGDFYDKQVLIHEDFVTIIDLDQACLSDPASDLGLFVAHIDRDCLQGIYTPEQARSFSSSLLKGYCERRSLDGVERFHLYQAMGLFSLATQPFRYRMEQWPEKTESLLHRVTDMLSE